MGLPTVLNLCFEFALELTLRYYLARENPILIFELADSSSSFTQGFLMFLLEVVVLKYKLAYDLSGIGNLR